MKNLTTAIFGKMTSATALYADIGGRMYEKGCVPGRTEYPYIVFQVISYIPDDAFAKKGKIAFVQFSLYSATPLSANEVKTMLADLNTLYDDCSMTITGSTLVWMKWTNTAPMTEEHTTPSGVQSVFHYAVEYEITTEAS